MHMHMYLMFWAVWFCRVSVPMLLFKCKVIPVKSVRADVHSCIQNQKNLDILYYVYILITFHLSCNLMVMLLRNKYRYSDLLSNGSLILLVLPEAAD